MNANRKEIEQAIKYLIRLSQIDNTDIVGKIHLAKYINKRAPSDIAIEFQQKYFKKKFNPYEIMKGSFIEVRPKGVNISLDNESSAANKPPVFTEFSDYLYYFRLSIEAQICEIIWIMKYGKQIDDRISDCVYANRLSLNEEYLFKYYWDQYRKWRDNGFNHELLTSTKVNKSIISFDISRFYNSISVENIDKENTKLFPIYIWKEYDEQVAKYSQELVGTLPIGPYSSAIFSNEILSEFDDKIKTAKSVLYYGRYVDDILIVHEKGEDSFSINSFSTNINGVRTFESNRNTFKFNDSKTRIYDYDLAHPMNTYVVFKRLIESSSSEWKLAPDQELSETDFSKAISSIDSEYSINKPRSFSEIKFDYKELRNSLSKYLIEFSAVDYLKKNEANEIVRGLCFAFSGGNAIKYYELWPVLFSVFRFIPDEEAIVKISDNIIKNLSIISDTLSQKMCTQYLHKHLLCSYIYASANYNKAVNRDVFGHIKNLVNVPNTQLPTERDVNKLLYLSLERKLLFNKQKTFEECIKHYDFNLIGFEKVTSSTYNQTKITSECLSLNTISIGWKSRLKVALAHVDVFDLSVEKAIKGIRKVSIYDFQKIIKPLNDAIKSRAHFLCFPEVSIPERLLSLLITYSSLKGITILAGIEHCKYKGLIGNFIVLIQPTKGSVSIYARPKIHYAPAEIALFKKNKISNFWIGSTFPIFAYKNTSIAVYNCFELADIILRGLVKGKVDAVFGIEYNFDLKYFSNIMESMCRDNHAYCVQSNAGQIGENRIIAPIDTKFADLVRFKAGLDPMAITGLLDIYKLQEFHSDKKTLYDAKKGIEFRKLPPGFNENDRII